MSMLAAILMVVLLGIVLTIVLSPLNAIPRRRSRRCSDEHADLQARRESKYQEIRDADLDYKMGKLTQEDHEAIDGELRAEALQILDRIEELEQASDAEPTSAN
jgi:F0F1-type ATP synthase membrane subunit b/b'